MGKACFSEQHSSTLFFLPFLSNVSAGKQSEGCFSGWANLRWLDFVEIGLKWRLNGKSLFFWATFHNPFFLPFLSNVSAGQKVQNGFLRRALYGTPQFPFLFKNGLKICIWKLSLSHNKKYYSRCPEPPKGGEIWPARHFTKTRKKGEKKGILADVHNGKRRKISALSPLPRILSLSFSSNYNKNGVLVLLLAFKGGTVARRVERAMRPTEKVNELRFFFAQ